VSRKTYWIELGGEIGRSASTPMEAVEKAMKFLVENPEFCICRVYHVYDARDNFAVEKNDFTGWDVREKLKEVKSEETKTV